MSHLEKTIVKKWGERIKQSKLEQKPCFRQDLITFPKTISWYLHTFCLVGKILWISNPETTSHCLIAMRRCFLFANPQNIIAPTKHMENSRKCFRNANTSFPVTTFLVNFDRKMRSPHLLQIRRILCAGPLIQKSFFVSCTSVGKKNISKPNYLLQKSLIQSL